MSESGFNTECVAIIGMTGRFPGAVNLDSFWNNLVLGVESIRPLSQQELRSAGVPNESLHQKGYVAAAASLDNFDRFDAEFFGFTPRQAECMDPQHRLFLECAWEVMEHAGYVPGVGSERVGVFAGCGLNAYLLSQLVGNNAVKPDDAFQISISNDKDFLPTRVSYQLNLKGPSVNVNTACSTSLSAVHFAVQSLLSFQSDMALAGGVTLQIPQNQGYSFEEGGILSPDGHCRPFDRLASGTVPGSGVGVVLLKRLSEAIRDNDFIHAVIRGSAINNDGSQKVGFTAPGITGQTEVIAEAQALAEVDPATIGFVEGHGTGTVLGDPIEVTALTNAFRLRTGKKSFCALGSLKGNMGHLDAASGVAGLIKTALVLEHGIIPPTPNYSSNNPRIDMENSPFFVNAKAIPWPDDSTPRRAGVSSFGIGGTNVHLVLEQAPLRKSSGSSTTEQVVCLSARTKAALGDSVRALREFLIKHPDSNLADVAYTLALGRKAFECRFAFAANSVETVIQKLAEWPSEAIDTKNDSSVSGQMAQMWSKGGEVSWSQVFACENRMRLVLPTYSFQRKRFWIEKQNSVTKNKSNSLFLIPSWKRERLAKADQAQAGLNQFLVFVNDTEISNQLCARFPGSVQVTAGKEFKKLDVLHYTLNPENKDHYTLLLSDMRKAGSLPETIIHLWNLNRSAASAGTSMSFYNTLYLVQALGACGLNFNFQVFVISCGIHAVLGNEDLDPARALLLGPMRVAPQEYPNIRTVNIDLESHSEEGILNRVIPEFASRISRPLVAYRGNQRWVPCFETWAPAKRASSAFRQNGVYLITGGLGGVGLELAEHLAKTCKAKLVLVGRRRLEQYGETSDGNTGLLPLQELRRVAGDLQVSSAPKSLSDFPMMQETLNDFCNACILAYFAKGGIKLVPGVPISIPQLKVTLRIQSKFDKFFDFFIRSLELDGLVARLGDAFVPNEKIGLLPPSEQILTRAEEQFPAFSGIFRLVKHCSDHYQEVFRGEKTPISVLYPEGKTDIIQASDSATTGHGFELHHAKLLKELLVSVRNRRAGIPLRVLEIGGGNGNLTKILLPALDGSIDYHFTDLGKTFLLRAEKEAQDSGLKGIRFSQFDISKDPSAQGLETSSYDFIFGLNVVHATRNVVSTLRNLKSLLKPDGLLGLIETTSSDRSIDMVWGLADGWWFYDDYELRKHGPLMPVESWQVAFEKAGFGKFHPFPESAEGLHRADCALLLATPVSNENQIDRSSIHFKGSAASRKDIEARLKRIRSLGSEVLTLQVDAGDEAQVFRAIQEARQKFGTIHGVIHAALDLRGSTIDQKTSQDTELEFAPKVKGSLILDNLFRDANLDFLVFFSSQIALTGGVGTVGYCAASSFQDALAQIAWQKGRTHVKSINWDRWRGVGNVVAAYEQWYKERTGHELSEGLTASESIAALEACLGAIDLPQIIVSADDFEETMKDAYQYQLVNNEHTLKPVAIHDRPSLSTPFAGAATESQGRILDIWSSVLGIQKIGIKDDFSELGGDSLIAIQVISRLREAFKLELTVRYLYERPTVESLAEGIDNLKWSSKSSSENVDATEEEVGVL